MCVLDIPASTTHWNNMGRMWDLCGSVGSHIKPHFSDVGLIWVLHPGFIWVQCGIYVGNDVMIMHH